MPKNKDNKDLITGDKTELQEVLEKIPDDLLIEAVVSRIQKEPSVEIKKVVRQVTESSFSGPIPPPKMLGEYDSVQNGLADRIVSMAESQQSHRQELEKKSVNAAIATESRGQNYALIVSVLIIAGSLYLIGSGKQIAGTLLAGSTLLGLAYLFIRGRKRKADEPSDED